MANVGYATLSVIPSFDGFRGNLERGVNGPLAAAGASGGRVFGDSAGRTAGSRFGSLFKTAAKASLVGVAGLTAGAFAIGKDAVGEASDLGESLNAVNVSYGRSAKGVKRLGREAAAALGLSNKEFNNLAVRFSGFSKQIAGKDKSKIVGTLDDLTGRAADFASVMNLDVAEAAGLFQSGLAGETEPLRRFGIDLSAAAVEAHAYKTGIAEAGAELTESEKVQARYSALMEQTAQTQGDFANTSDSLANRQRILNARWDDARAKLGKALLPIVEDFTGYLIDHGIPAIENFSDWFNETGGPAIEGFIEKAKPLIKNALPKIRNGFKEIRNFAKEAVPYAEGIISAFDDMPSWVKKVLIGGGAAAFTANKILPGSPASAGKGLLSLVTKAKPLPVFVTNPGFGVPGSKVPPVVPTVPTTPPAAALPKWAPLIPVGIGSAPSQDSLMRELFGVGFKGDKSDALPWPPPEDIKEAGGAFKEVEGKIDTARLAQQKFISEIDKTPRQVQVRFNSEGVAQILADAREIEAALARVGAGGAPNTPDEATPRGYGSAVIVQNQTVVANSPREIADETRRQARKRQRAGH